MHDALAWEILSIIISTKWIEYRISKAFFMKGCSHATDLSSNAMSLALFTCEVYSNLF